MKINVRHEPATAADEPPGSEATEERTCVWIVGDDGETQNTAYPKPGEQVTIDVTTTPAVTAAEMGPVTGIAA